MDKKRPNFDLNTQKKLSIFSLARLLLMTTVLFTTIFLRQEVLGEAAILQIYTVLGASFLFSLVTVVNWEQTLRVRYYMASQLLYDLLLTSYLVYLTGVNDSIFLFLYLLNIVFSSVVYQLNGALFVAGVSGAIYAFIYSANSDIENANVLYNLAYNELLFLLTALLCGQLMDELKRQKTILESQRVNIERLELLNDRLLNSIPVGIVLVGADEYVTNINQTALVLLKLNHPPEIRMKYYELLPDLKGILDTWGKMTETQRLRFLFRASDQKRPSLALQVVKIESETEGVTGQAQHILVFEDVSDMLELEKKLEFESKLSATGQLAAGIAHEIRNPLASISGSIEMLSKHLQIEDEQDRKLMAISVREIHRLNHLITDFLEFAKPRDNSADRFLLHSLVQEVREAILSRVTDTLALNIENQIPVDAGVLANRERIKQVFFNLFLNSVEAAVQSPLVISITAHAKEGHWVLDLKDNGPGVKSEHAAKIFDPFFTTKPSGTGLGLPTVAQIVKAAKGEIKLLSSSQGAHFRLTLPSASGVELAGTGT